MMVEYLPDIVFFSDRLKNDYKEEWQSLKNILKKHRIRSGLLEGTLDIWCRDYMPVQVDDAEFVQFVYNSSYLKGPEFDAKRTIPENIPEREQFNPVKSNIILDGGNVVRHKDIVLISDRVKDDNPGIATNHLQRELESLLHAEIIWIPDHGPDTDFTGHADGLVRFIDGKTLLVNDRKKDYAGWVRQFEKAVAGRGYHVEDIPFFEYAPPGFEDSAIGCYLNYLQVGKLIVVPLFEAPDLPYYYRKKAEAIDRKIPELFKGWFPEHAIEPVSINRIAAWGGLMNCITWNTKTPVPLYRNTPIHDF